MRKASLERPQVQSDWTGGVTEVSLALMAIMTDCVIMYSPGDAINPIVAEMRMLTGKTERWWTMPTGRTIAILRLANDCQARGCGRLVGDGQVAVVG